MSWSVACFDVDVHFQLHRQFEAHFDGVVSCLLFVLVWGRILDSSDCLDCVRQRTDASGFRDWMDGCRLGIGLEVVDDDDFRKRRQSFNRHTHIFFL
jgi:hypothetical protein